MKFPPLRLAVLASGSGTNLAAIIANIESGKLDSEIRLVISNKAEAGALAIARSHGIPAFHLEASQFPDPNAFDDNFLQLLSRHQIEMIILAGYLKKLSAQVVQTFRRRILNIHPALLPAFGGKGMYGHHVHQAVLDYGCKVTGVTVHIVDPEYDSGTPVLQRCVPVLQDDSAETLAARVLKEEHQIYSEAIQLFAERRVQINGRKVIIKPEN